MRVPINIAGQTHVSRSGALSNQVTQNWYAQVSDNAAAKSGYVLMPFPGLSLLGTESGFDRGMYVHRGKLYKVTGGTLWEVDTGGSHTSLGAIPGTGRCILQGIGSNVVIVCAGKAYQYDGGTVTEITDVDLESPNSCAHLNNQLIYDGDEGRFCSSDVGDATSVNGLNYSAAESNADELLRVFAHNQYLYLIGTDTVETWWNSGVGKPPFERVEQGIMQFGCAALHSVASNDDAWFLLGDDNHVYRISGLERSQVTTTAIHRAIEDTAEVSDAIGLCFDLEGQRFYHLSLPSADVSYLFSESTGWTSTRTAGGRHAMNSYAYFDRKHLIADHRGGAIYQLDFDTYSDAGVASVRIRDTGPIHGGLLGMPGARVEMDSFEVIMETGVGGATDPLMSLQVSDDGGKTWSTEMWEKMGKSGEYNTMVSWHALGSFYQRQMRLQVSDAVFCSIHAAAAEIKAGI